MRYDECPLGCTSEEQHRAHMPEPAFHALGDLVSVPREKLTRWIELCDKGHGLTVAAEIAAIKGEQ